MLWDEDTKQKMVEMWNEGSLSASDIANRLGKGLTRNSVVAKAWRLRLAGFQIRQRGSENSGRPKKRQGKLPTLLRKRDRIQKPNQPKRSPLELAMRAVPFKPSADTAKPTVMSIAELEAHHCRWPIGSPGESEFGFCGQDRFMSLPYCPHHCRMGYQTPAPAQRAPVAQPETRSHDLVMEDA